MFDLSVDDVMDARLAFARQVGGREARAVLRARGDDAVTGAATALRMRQRTVAELIGEACQIYAITREALLSRCKVDRLARARQWVMYHAIREGRCSMPDIGRRLGGRDHSTVLHGARVHGERYGLAPLGSGKVWVYTGQVACEGAEPSIDNPWDPAMAANARMADRRQTLARWEGVAAAMPGRA